MPYREILSPRVLRTDLASSVRTSKYRALNFTVRPLHPVNNNNLLTGATRSVLGNTKPDLLVQPELARAVHKSKGFVFLVRTKQPVSKSFLYGIIISQTKTIFLQFLHIVWQVILMCTNSLSDIKVSENNTR